MLTVLLVRPGSTDFDEQGRMKGTLDIPLNQHGTEQVARTCAEMESQPLDAVYCAPCQVAQQTAQAIAAQKGVKVKELPQLKNLDHGLWHGKLIDEIRQKQPKIYRQFQESPESCCPPQGEPVSDACERVRQGITKILKKHKKGSVAIVTPEPVLSMVRSILMQSEMGDLWKSECECGNWETVRIEPAEVALRE